MTPEEWDRCEDPHRMLEFLRGRASDRKLRLVACACCRRIWDLISPDPGRRAVETAERWADGQATEQEVRDARSRSFGFADPGTFPRYADAFGVTVLSDRAWDAAAQAATWATRYKQEPGDREPAAQSLLLRCIMGNPFRPPPTVPDSVLAHNGGSARRLVECIYAARGFEDLPVLADLLEEAGLSDAALLGHLRGPGPHALGCWALDAVLGKS